MELKHFAKKLTISVALRCVCGCVCESTYLVVCLLIYLDMTEGTYLERDLLLLCLLLLFLLCEGCACEVIAMVSMEEGSIPASIMDNN